MRNVILSLACVLIGFFAGRATRWQHERPEPSISFVQGIPHDSLADAMSLLGDDMHRKVFLAAKDGLQIKRTLRSRVMCVQGRPVASSRYTPDVFTPATEAIENLERFGLVKRLHRPGTVYGLTDMGREIEIEPRAMDYWAKQE